MRAFYSRADHATRRKAPRCLESLGTVLSLLDRASSCYWGCRGGDHVIEYFAGRVASSSRAALANDAFCVSTTKLLDLSEVSAKLQICCCSLPVKMRPSRTGCDLPRQIETSTSNRFTSASGSSNSTSL